MMPGQFLVKIKKELDDAKEVILDRLGITEEELNLEVAKMDVDDQKDDGTFFAEAFEQIFDMSEVNSSFNYAAVNPNHQTIKNQQCELKELRAKVAALTLELDRLQPKEFIFSQDLSQEI